MRVTLLPRETAARVITGAVSVLAWAAGAATIVLVIPVLIETLVRRGDPAAIPVPLALLLLILAAIAVAVWRMTPLVVAAYLVFAGSATAVYEVFLITTDPTLLEQELYLVNRPTLALVAIGVAAPSALGGIMWCVAGYATATAVAVVSSVVTNTPFRPGLGTAMVLLVAIVLYLTLFAIQARQRRRFPQFDQLELATRRLAASADLASRTTAVVHDTVLNDLAVVMNAPDTLDPRARQRLADDLDTLAGGEWMRAIEQVPVHDEEQARIRNELTKIASDFRWRGLTVNVTGARPAVYRFAPGAGDALVAALRATLENVLRHAGATSADVEIVYSDDRMTFMVSDQGVGFDPAEVDPQRLGIRTSIVGRMEAVGGEVRVWSSPGAGTTVIIAAPVSEVLERGEPSRHQESDYDD